MHDEEWRPVMGYEGLYEVSDQGRVRSVDRIDSNGSRRKAKLLRSSASGTGYRKICLSQNSQVRQVNLHRLVALHFLPNPNDLPEVDHINCIRDDNRASNLQWVSCSQNRCLSWSRGSRVVDPVHMAKMRAARWNTNG